jgi:hypothetical protein
MATGGWWLNLERIVFSREMGFTANEFERTLPAALNHRPCDKTPTGYRVAIDAGTMELAVSEQKYRKIASISLPYLSIDFTFDGLSDTQVQEVMRYFDLRFQRGGG